MSGLPNGEIRARVITMREFIEDGRRKDGSLPGYVVVDLEIVLEGLEVDLDGDHSDQWTEEIDRAA
jgi:hypothetical protein